MHQFADAVVDHRRRDAGAQAEAIAEIRRDVVFAAGDVDVEGTRLAKRNDAGIEPMDKGADGQKVQRTGIFANNKTAHGRYPKLLGAVMTQASLRRHGGGDANRQPCRRRRAGKITVVKRKSRPRRVTPSKGPSIKFTRYRMGGSGVVRRAACPCLAADAPAHKRNDSASEKLDMKLSLQCWTFNRLSFFETVDRTKILGVKYLEMYPGQRLKPGSKSPFITT